MLSSGAIIILIWGLIIFVPLIAVISILLAVKYNRKRKKQLYTGITQGVIDEIKYRGIDSPDVICVTYCVNNKEYHIKETIKLKSELIKIGVFPVGQRKSYRMGNIATGDMVQIQYDEKNPQRAIISENDGLISG